MTRLQVLAAGPQVTLQDGGRRGMMRFGVPASGALDRKALALANLALGNPPGAAGIEVSFVGQKWKRVRKSERQKYLKNAYRVLLTRARQGMVIVVPPGDTEDPTRLPEIYNPTYEYLKGIGFPEI